MALRTGARVEAIQAGRTVTCPKCGSQWIQGVDHLPSAIYCSSVCRTRAWKRQAAGERRDGVGH